MLRESDTPVRTASPFPRLTGWLTTRWWGRWVSRARAVAAVPSVLPSSTTSTSVRRMSTAPSATAASKRLMPSDSRWASLKAGTTMVSSSVMVLDLRP